MAESRLQSVLKFCSVTHPFAACKLNLKIFSLQMRVLIDASCVEVYLGTGEVMSTRIYRGDAPRGSDSGVDFVAFNGKARVTHVEAWEMSSIWAREKQNLPRNSQIFDAANVMGAPIPV